MQHATIGLAIFLLGLGAVGYMGGGSDSKKTAKNDAASTDAVDGKEGSETKPKSKSSVTALIPAIAGVLFLGIGILGYKPGMRKHAMHAAVGLALLCGLACLGRVGMKIGPIMSGSDEVNMRATLFVLLMMIACFIYVGMGVQSFIAARKARLAAESTGEKNSA